MSDCASRQYSHRPRKSGASTHDVRVAGLTSRRINTLAGQSRKRVWLQGQVVSFCIQKSVNITYHTDDLPD